MSVKIKLYCDVQEGKLYTLEQAKEALKHCEEIDFNVAQEFLSDVGLTALIEDLLDLVTVEIDEDVLSKLLHGDTLKHYDMTNDKYELIGQIRNQYLHESSEEFKGE